MTSTAPSSLSYRFSTVLPRTILAKVSRIVVERVRLDDYKELAASVGLSPDSKEMDIAEFGLTEDDPGKCVAADTSLKMSIEQDPKSSRPVVLVVRPKAPPPRTSGALFFVRHFIDGSSSEIGGLAVLVRPPVDS